MKIAELFWQLRGEAGRAAGARDARARRRAGVGRPDAGRDRGRDGFGWGRAGWRAAGWWRRPRSACPAIPYPAPRGRRHLEPCDLAVQPSVVGCRVPLGRRIRRRRARHLVRVGSGRGDGRVPRRAARRDASSPRIACRASGRWCRRGSSASGASGRPIGGRRSPAIGAVETFSICHVSWDMQPVDPPELPGRDPARRREPGRVPAQAGRGGAGRRRDRDGGRGRVASARGADRVDPGHRVLPAGREVVRDGADRQRWDAGRVPLHARCGEHRVLRGAPRSRRAARVALRGVRVHVPAGADLLRAVLRGARRPTPSAVRAARSSRSRSGTSTSTASALDEPVTIGLVRLDGADTVLMHSAARRRAVGDRRSRRHASCGTERTGSIDDIEGFRSA